MQRSSCEASVEYSPPVDVFGRHIIDSYLAKCTKLCISIARERYAALDLAFAHPVFLGPSRAERRRIEHLFLVDPVVLSQLVALDLTLLEPESDLLLGRLDGVGAVAHVAADILSSETLAISTSCVISAMAC